jgi:hypothetical protein
MVNIRLTAPQHPPISKPTSITVSPDKYVQRRNSLTSRDSSVLKIREILSHHQTLGPQPW